MMAHDASLWAGSAALGALDPEERAEFDRHLENCAACRSELAGFAETAARLGAAAAEPPPVSMRSAVMAMVAVTRQLPPEVHGHEEHFTERVVASSDTALSQTPTSPLRMPPEQPSAEVVDIFRRRRVAFRVLTVAASAVAIALVAVGAVFLSNRDADDHLADPLMSCVLTAPDRATPEPLAGSVGEVAVTVSTACGAALVELSKIPPAPEGSTYQLWVMAGEGARSVGTMEPDDEGNMPDTVAQLQDGDDTIGVTVEPDGGSAGPTTTPVITVPIRG